MLGIGILLVIGVAAAAGLGGITVRIAAERGRSRFWCGVAAAVAPIAGCALGVIVGDWAMLVETWGLLLAEYAPWLLATGFSALVVLVVKHLPERMPDLGGASWPVYRMSTDGQPGHDCTLSICDGALRIGDTLIAAPHLAEVTADGESVRVRWRDGEAQLVPMGDPDTHDARVRSSLALERRLRAHMTEWSPPVAAPGAR
jgi:hypothetical protein